MLRLIRTTVICIALMLAVLCLALWVRGYYVHDFLDGPLGKSCFNVQSYGGRIEVAWGVGSANWRHEAQPVRDITPPKHKQSFAGVGYSYAPPMKVGLLLQIPERHSIGFPVYYLFALTLILPTLQFV